VAADFLVAITAGFRVLYVFVVMEVGSRRILHCNVTAHPTAAWTVQQFREAIPSDHTYRFLIHDRDSLFSAEVDDDLGAFGLRVLRTPVQAPKANAYCERLIGSMRRECLDWVIPLNEKHLRRILREWVAITIADARRPVLVREFQSRLLRDGQAQSIPDTNYCRIVG
jgi:transposase InsO family protein